MTSNKRFGCRCRTVAGFVLAAICLILPPQNAAAQQNGAHDSKFPSRATQFGGPIYSVSSDPFMSPSQEQAILKELGTIDASDWSGWSVSDLQSYLSQRMSVSVDEVELDLVGVSTAAPTSGKQQSPACSLGAKLGAFLGQLELEFAISGNRLVITSCDAVCAEPSTRVYDVTPLVLRSRHGQRLYDFDRLANIIMQTVAPDSWVAHGGTDSIMSIASGVPGQERGLLAIACSTSSHLKIQTLLDRLNGYTGSLVSSQTRGWSNRSEQVRVLEDSGQAGLDPFGAPSAGPFESRNANPF